MFVNARTTTNTFNILAIQQDTYFVHNFENVAKFEIMFMHVLMVAGHSTHLDEEMDDERWQQVNRAFDQWVEVFGKRVAC